MRLILAYYWKAVLRQTWLIANTPDWRYYYYSGCWFLILRVSTLALDFETSGLCVADLVKRLALGMSLKNGSLRSKFIVSKPYFEGWNKPPQRLASDVNEEGWLYKNRLNTWCNGVYEKDGFCLMHLFTVTSTHFFAKPVLLGLLLVCCLNLNTDVEHDCD